MNARYLKPYLWLKLAALFIILLSGCGGEEGRGSKEKITLTVSAASSLRDALEKLELAFVEVHPEIQLQFNFGSSGSLRQQIEEGAPVDLFISASSEEMQSLVTQQLVEPHQQTPLLSNSIVVVTAPERAGEIKTIQDLAGENINKIALGIPESVPAGRYAKESLQAAGLWEDVQDHMIQAKDVRQVLQYVKTGNVDAGFVYQSDAQTTDQAVIALKPDRSTYSAVIYPIGIVKATKYTEQAQQLYDFLRGDEAILQFQSYGFDVVE
ncbi:molybdate ABC transporter substrate-binding protein [Paenibacillus sp. JSM ZJ436]|uniref:molybdate ABC transporter substrate-binding protein n=1 Tax=Paenibacillus sp. JSM ZJ436 TaxID=3376190 RepID=UPI0037A2E4E4